MSKKQSRPRHPIDSTDAKDILRRFVVRARRVEAHSMVRDHSVEKYVKPSMKVEYKEGQPPRIKYAMPDQEIFESLVARTRPCILESEPVYMDKVFRSIDMLLGERHLTGQSKRCMDSCRMRFHNLCDKDKGISYSIQVYDENDVPEGEPLSDLLVGETWLYSDLVHADPKKDKAKAAGLSYRDRYYAGTSFFSALAIIIVDTLNLVTTINGQLQLGIDDKAWKEQVVASEEDSEVETEKLVVLPPNTKIPDGVDPSTLPNAIDVTSPTEAIRAFHPERSTEIVLLDNAKLIDKVHGAYSWNGDVLTVLIADALIIELDTAKIRQVPKLRKIETHINRRFTKDEKAIDLLQPSIQKSNRLLTAVPYGESNVLYVDCPLTTATVNEVSGQ